MGLGDNFSGQLGNGDATLPHPPAKDVPVKVLNPSGIPYVSIAAGDSYSAARRADGTLWSWGNNTSGQLGTGPVSVNDKQLTRNLIQPRFRS